MVAYQKAYHEILDFHHETYRVRWHGEDAVNILLFVLGSSWGGLLRYDVSVFCICVAGCMDVSAP